MKKKILIVENYSHYKNAKENKKLFSLKFDTTLCYMAEHQKMVGQINKHNKKIILSKFLIYFWVMVYSKRFDYIYISTPPEYPEPIRSLNQAINFFVYYIPFAVMLFFLEKKIIIQIRAIHKYFYSESKFLSSKFRFLIILLGERFILESNFLKEKFKKLKNDDKNNGSINNKIIKYINFEPKKSIDNFISEIVYKHR